MDDRNGFDPQRYARLKDAALEMAYRMRQQAIDESWRRAIRRLQNAWHAIWECTDKKSSIDP
jgi:hypothetical protein